LNKKERCNPYRLRSHAFIQECQKMKLHKVTVYTLGAIGSFALVCTMVFFIFPDIFPNGYVKKQIVKAFAKAFPAYSMRIAGVHYTLWKNRIQFDRIALTSIDSTFSCTIGKVSVSGISWLQILRHGDIASKVLKGSFADAREITLGFQRAQYELHCKRLSISIPDSEISTDELKFHPLVNDAKLFSNSKFRKTRYRINCAECKVTGADLIGLLQGKAYCARSVKVNGAFFDILVNMDAPARPNSSRSLMPCEALSSIKKITQVDILNIYNGRLKYNERYIVGSPPAEVTFDSVRLTAEGIKNHAARGATAIIHGQGSFMKTSSAKIRMIIPVISPEIPLRYSGSLDNMDLTRLNSFLETGERLRIKSGLLETATFDIAIIGARASGSLRAMYKDLDIVVLDKQTGSENGALNRIASFMINTMKIRGTNIPDASGQMKIGMVKYTQKKNDTFLQLVWFSLRSGIGDVVGF
jgi:hypothetical protein